MVEISGVRWSLPAPFFAVSPLFPVAFFPHLPPFGTPFLSPSQLPPGYFHSLILESMSSFDSLNDDAAARKKVF